MSTADDLRNAAHVLDARGWTQRRLLDLEGRLCALGAISAATVWAATGAGTDPLATLLDGANGREECNAAIRALCRFLDIGSLPHWNDGLPLDSGEFVAKTFRACADALEDSHR